jgi:3'-phosphoadenosine 5'-phosphosulfate sulfotransferase (PAPS reductase)/FAD synthetase
MGNPYLITGPALISFSGGRTSAFMLWNILQAHGGKLPDDIVVTFANTGLEDERTLRFVHECGTRWGVRIHWLEWRNDETGFEEVGFNSASRSGEPFKALVAKKKYTPNGVTRFCTQELKIRVMGKFCRSLGWEHWTNVVGLRYDEGSRILKALARNEAGKERWRTSMPMAAKAVKAVKRDVMAFWLGENADPVDLKHPLPQGFDLGLRDYEGNCTLCFLKAKAKLLRLIREQPGAAQHMIEMEVLGKGRFVTEYSYTDLVSYADRSPMLPGIMDDAWGDEHDAECGLWCGSEAA